MTAIDGFRGRQNIDIKGPPFPLVGEGSRRATMRPHAWFMDDIELRAYTIETVNSQLEKMGIERLYARTNAGFDLKVHATLIALICTNMN